MQVVFLFLFSFRWVVFLVSDLVHAEVRYDADINEFGKSSFAYKSSSLFLF